MTFDKAKRILPSFVSHFANDAKDLESLRRMVEVYHFRLGGMLMNMLGATFDREEVNALDLKRERLQRFLETTK
jgi:hypothetical protein